MFKIKLLIFLMLFSTVCSVVVAQDINNTWEIQVSPDGHYIVAIGDIIYPYFRVWDVENDSVLINIFPYVDAETTVYDVDWSPDNTRVAVTSGDGYLRVWNIADTGYTIGAMLGEMKTNGVRAPVEWSPDGHTIAVGVNFGGSSIQFWDATTYLLQETTSSSEIELMDWSRITNEIVAVFDPVFDPPYPPHIVPGIDSNSDYTVLCPDECAQDYPRSVKWSHDGTKVAIGTTGGIQIIDVSLNVVILEIVTGSSVFTIDWSYDDRFLVGLNNGVKIWSAETGEVLGTVGRGSAVDFSPDAYEVVYIDRDLVDLVVKDVSYLLPTACDHSIISGDVTGLISAVNSANADPDATTICDDE